MDVDPFMDADPEIEKTSLYEMEKNMSMEEKILFENRLENGYDLDTDETYNKWKALKEEALAGE